MARPIKKFSEYIESSAPGAESTLDEYARSPAHAFLVQVAHIFDAVNQCKRHFPKKTDGTYTSDSQDSLYIISTAALASLMSHFETFQRFTLAGLIEVTRLIPNFKIEVCCRKLEQVSRLNLSLVQISGYRGQPASIGRLVSDNLSGWHEPEKVNDHFKAIMGSDFSFYSNKEIRELRVLWQLRHSIVHTAGWLTQPDAQKVKELNDFGNMPIKLGINFIPAVVRRMHPIVKRGINHLEEKYRVKLPTKLTQAEQEEISNLFNVDSPIASWLP